MSVDLLSCSPAFSPATERALSPVEGLWMRFPAEGEIVHANGMAIRILNPPATSQGPDSPAGSIVECRMSPQFAAPVPHSHTRTLESFYVLAGTLTFVLAPAAVAPTGLASTLTGDEGFNAHRIVAPAGTYVVVPPGVWHTFGNPEPVPCTFLQWSMPGGVDAYFREAARFQALDQPLEAAAWAELYARYDMVFPL